MSLDDNLDRVLKRQKELTSALAGDAQSDLDAFARMSKEYSDLAPVVERVEALRGAQSEMADLAELIADPEGESEMKALAEEEFRALKDRLPDLERELKLLLVPKDEADEKNAILEVRAGTGGEEAGLFAAELFRMYQRYAELKGWKFELMNISETGIGAYKEASAAISRSPHSIKGRITLYFSSFVVYIGGIACKRPE